MACLQGWPSKGLEGLEFNSSPLTCKIHILNPWIAISRWFAKANFILGPPVEIYVRNNIVCNISELELHLFNELSIPIPSINSFAVETIVILYSFCKSEWLYNIWFHTHRTGSCGFRLNFQNHLDKLDGLLSIIINFFCSLRFLPWSKLYKMFLKQVLWEGGLVC